MVLLRQIPGDTAIHRLWAGTKMLAVVTYGVVLSLVPSWPGIVIGAVMLLAVARIARVPRSALPRLPVWFWVVMAAGGLFTLVSGGKPEISVGSGHVGLGDLELYVRFVCLSVVLLGASAMVAWTTSLGDVAPAVARVGAPLRWLRLPVDEWAVTTALCIRSLPLLVDEMRTVMAARRLRPGPPGHRWSLNTLLDEGIDLMTAALTASIRRAGEMGEAITARGGTGQLTSQPAGPGWPDALAAAVVAVASGAAIGLASVA
ncbi:energy-coupling factor transporter transmembrane protein EcfT [Acidiferrimicrobium sp. IK]|uniref:energy-coupling factor transporter transmembrane component T family protein n=1 Tax=Acidiferrimicrobium sp. IK TaxID=2871700 RepID=UPI0021CB7FD3|nr:energy-coupling factor transporter transmembrane protein EcfT [Acidiferrimicrobium sp. IK]MCU4184141.1 energy-coupling factor transporter transmembrane protein EcfT [Acidiferrimicrobium sp. IK]